MESHQRTVREPVVVIIHVIPIKKERGVFGGADKSVPFLLPLAVIWLDQKGSRMLE